MFARSEGDNASEVEDSINLYSIEMVNGERLVVCNVCTEGFASYHYLDSHMNENHNEILSQKEWTYVGKVSVAHAWSEKCRIDSVIV